MTEAIGPWLNSLPVHLESLSWQQTAEANKTTEANACFKLRLSTYCVSVLGSERKLRQIPSEERTYPYQNLISFCIYSIGT